MAVHNLINSLVRLHPKQRRLFLITADAFFIPLAVWLSFWLSQANPLSPQLLDYWWLMPLGVLIAPLLYSITGQYRGLTRYVGSHALYQLMGRNLLLVLLLFSSGIVLRLPLPPLSSWVLLWMLLTAATGSVRFALRDWLLRLQRTTNEETNNVAIYGAGQAGGQLAGALRLAKRNRVQLFLDDNPALWGRNLNGVTVHPPQVLRQKTFPVDQVLLAIPSLSRSRRRRIVEDLQEGGWPVLQMPSVDDIASGRASIDSLQPIAIEDLLGRDTVPPNPELLGPGIVGETVCVTGAGGSIGSELCRQILKLKPLRLVLLERSEPSLYAIHQELSQQLPSGVNLIAALGSATDQLLVERLFRKHQVSVIFHAAAYKHVPLVETNPLAGLTNNVLSTKVVCEAAELCGARQVVLISTDKAVRPTNVMGASKRVAELVLQAKALELAAEALANGRRPVLRLAMVRFGNVLGSSGSVVPLFRSQIAAGGPLTITHPEIIRYFMTIPEAAQLVLQAAVLSDGGDLFLLDMGQPVRIKDLAEQMVHLSGLTLRNADHPDGDIEIVCTGLRPGEKLYEELLIEAESETTSHPLIYRARERTIHPTELWPLIESLEDAILSNETEASLELLSLLVPEWQRSEYHKSIQG